MKNKTGSLYLRRRARRSLPIPDNGFMHGNFHIFPETADVEKAKDIFKRKYGVESLFIARNRGALVLGYVPEKFKLQQKGEMNEL